MVDLLVLFWVILILLRSKFSIFLKPVMLSLNNSRQQFIFQRGECDIFNDYIEFKAEAIVVVEQLTELLRFLPYKANLYY